MIRNGLVRALTIALFAIPLTGFQLAAGVEGPGDQPSLQGTRAPRLHTLEDFFSRLEEDYGYQAAPPARWVAERGAPALTPDALYLALKNSRLTASLLIDEVKRLVGELDSTGGVAPATSADSTLLIDCLSRIQELARRLDEDAYLGFLDSGRTRLGRTNSTDPDASFPEAASQLFEKVLQIQAGIDAFLQGERHRVVDWRELARSSPLELAREVHSSSSAMAAGLPSAETVLSEALSTR